MYYWKRCKAERQPFKYALFVSYFPQILQGPIGRYSRLAKPKALCKRTNLKVRILSEGFERDSLGLLRR